MKMKIGKSKLRQKFKTKRGLFHKDSGDLVQATIIIAGLVVSSVVVVGGVSSVTQTKGKATAECINNSTGFGQGAVDREDCKKTEEEAQEKGEEVIGGNFGGGSGNAPGSKEEEEEILECTYDESTEAEDRQAIEEVYREQLETLLRLSREETLDIDSFYAELEQAMGGTSESILQEIYAGTFDQKKIDKALEVSRKYFGEIPPPFTPEEFKGNKQLETLYEIQASTMIYEHASSIKTKFPFVETENVEFVINRDNFLYYGDSAGYSLRAPNRDKSKDVLKIYVNGEELEDRYTSYDNYSLHYELGIELVEGQFIKEDCSWIYIHSDTPPVDAPPGDTPPGDTPLIM